MPFGEYADFADCVAKNGDKADPQAYCAAIQQQVEGKRAPFGVVKIDEEQQLVFGYASVAKVNDGTDLVDLQGDLIAPDDLEKAAYDFVLHARVANEMHQGEPVGQLVESLMVTPEKLAAMGLRGGPGAPAVGFWLGFKLTPESFAKVKRGDYTMFSIEGTADEELVNA